MPSPSALFTLRCILSAAQCRWGWLLFLIGMVATLPAQTGRMQIEHLTVEQGLPSNAVFAILQDRKGFLWAGGDAGLYRYDGYDAKVYKNSPDDPNSLASNTVACVFEDRSGNIWAGTNHGISVLDPQTETFRCFEHRDDDPNSLSSNYASNILEDDAGRLFVISLDVGIDEFDPVKAVFHRYMPTASNQEPAGKLADSRLPNRFWVTILQDSTILYQFDTERRTFIRYGRVPVDRYTNTWQTVQDRTGLVWIATSQGVYTFDPDTGIFQPVTANPQAPRPLGITSTFRIVEDDAGKMWFCSRAGIYIYDRSTDTYSHYEHDPGDPQSLGSNQLSVMLKDRSGVMWVGTLDAGVDRFLPNYPKFRHYKATGKPGSLTRNVVTGFAEDAAGKIWVGLRGGTGLNQLDRTSSRFQDLGLPPKVNPKMTAYWVNALCEDRNGDLWIGVNNDQIGVLCRSRADGSYRVYRYDPADPTSVASNYIKVFCLDHNGELWLATADGLDRFDAQKQNFVHYRHDPQNPASLLSNAVEAIFEDRSGALWVGSELGLSRLDRRNDTFLHFTHASTNPQSLSSKQVNVITQDRTGAIWVGTPQGLNRFTFGPGDITGVSDVTITHYFTQDGLPSDFISGILEDGQGRLWISTNKGLAVLKNPQHGPDARPNFKTFSLKNGLQGYQFHEHAYYKSRSGDMFFGGLNGFNVFNPDSLADNAFIPPIVISALEKYDLDHPDWGARAEPGISLKNEITLSYKNNIFSLRFAALDFREPDKNQYAYWMEGFNDNWIQLGDQRQVTFTNLDPGTYFFHVKGTNNDGVWNETGTTLKIVITPPWWKTTWAYTTYLLLLLAAITGFIRFRLRYFKNRTLELERAVTLGTAQISAQKEQLEIQAGKLQELDRTKSNFYTNITHEFRTPLTVILGMAEQAEAHYPPPVAEKFRQAMTMIRRNGQNLLRLINQLLDLSKLDAGRLPLHLVQDDVIGFIAYLLQSFQSYAETKNVQLHFNPEPLRLMMDFDREKLQSIVANLVSNAVKFTPSGGHVQISTRVTAAGGHETLEIRVKDTGIGIPIDKLPAVFDRFFQVDGTHTRQAGGSGIGLALVKELVQLAGGIITVESTPGEGTEFRVRLPVSRVGPAADTQEAVPLPAFSEPDVEAAGEATIINPEETAGLPLLLIAEDNADVAHYLQACVSDGYQVALAGNGRQGIEMALELVPDLIISDVMMPEKDGFELCETLKNDERTSHVPIILLTAKADMASRIKGLSRGADAYLAKPFHREELLVQLQSLLQLRRKLHARYASRTPLPASEEADIQIEDRFLTKVRDLLFEHLADEHFGVNELAADIYLSPSQLFRKIKALTGQSPTIYLRSLRLQKGLALLADSALSIAEVAYQVGFSDPAYFSRAFSGEFGFAPSMARK